MEKKDSKSRLLFLLLFFIATGLMYAQQITVRGKCSDNVGPLPGVTVKIRGTTIGVMTDTNGEYSIDVPDKSTVLQFTSVGYTPVEEKVGDRTLLNVVMQIDDKSLDEVVVIGYQSVQKKFTSGTVASVTAKDIENLPAASFASLLAGKTAGLVIMNTGGAPGSGVNMQLRGNAVVSGSLGEANQFSNPLYVIDGVPTTLEDVAGYGKTNNDYLSSLNVEDIESIDILKDASAAAIYGSRGANGVIIIKTKAGTVGKMKVSIKAYTGITTRPELSKTPTGTAERRMKMALIENGWSYANKKSNIPIMLTDSLNPSFNNNLDYQGLFYQTGIVQDYSVAIRGGLEDLNYRLGIGYYDEEGILKNTGYKRYSVNLNVSQRPWERVRNQTIINASYQDRKPGAGDANGRGSFPVAPGNMNSSLFYLTDAQISFLRGGLESYYRTNRTINTQISNTLNVDIWNGLAFNSQTSISYMSNKINQFEPSVLRTDNQGKANYDYYERFGTNLEHYLSFSNYVATDHFVNALLGTSYEYNRGEEMHLEATGGSGDMIKTINGYRQEDITGRTSISENAMLSYWARFGYRFKDRYQVDINYRRDASSRFGKNNRWANFPSIGAYWIFSEEPFMEFSKDWLSFAKIKYTVGRTGRQFTNDYLRYNMYSLSYNSFGGMSQGNMNTTSYNGILATIPDFGKLADDKLSWEKSLQTDFGIDLEFFKNRLYASFNYYNKNTDALLFDVQFPDYTGFDMVKSNVAGIRNNGYEISVDAHLFPRTNDFTLQVTAGIAHNNNVITKLPNNNRDYIVSGDSYGYTVGKPGPLFYGLIYNGPITDPSSLPVNPFTGSALDPTKNGVWGTVVPGYPWFEDTSGDYLVSDNADQDQLLTNFNPNPKIAGHLNFNIGYKEWQLRMNTNFVFGRDVYDEVSQGILSRYDYGTWVNKGIVDLSNYDIWTPTNVNAYYPSLILQPSGSQARYAYRSGTTMWFEKGDFWKINDITLSYSFKKSWLKKINFERLYVYVTAYNVWQWQASDKLVDASMVDSRGYAIGDGYPQPRKYTIGINVEF